MYNNMTIKAQNNRNRVIIRREHAQTLEQATLDKEAWREDQEPWQQSEWGRGDFYDGCYDNMWDLKTQRWIACRWMLDYDGGSPSSPLSPMSDLFEED